ncbi:unnamed protein product [Schistosoma curassoni]|uniref:Uncharacterized protein n=1 Tax=Schistosoma curassoni TaxID=6186 RepID=A0A183K2L4_9TREM|nr:unnamed protein product [Schistosoma curassoni]
MYYLLLADLMFLVGIDDLKVCKNRFIYLVLVSFR